MSGSGASSSRLPAGSHRPPAGPRRRQQLGSPILPINATGAYLRHRAAAERAAVARRRATWRLRAGAAVILCLLWFAIGRELLGLVSARTGAAAMSIRHETQGVAKDLEQLVGAAPGAPIDTISPLTLTSAAVLAGTDDSDGLDAAFASHPADSVAWSR